MFNQIESDTHFEKQSDFIIQSTPELIDTLRKNKPIIYKQMSNNGAIDESMSHIDFYNLIHTYEQAIIYGVVNSVKIDYALFTKAELIILLNQLIDEIPAFEEILRDYEKNSKPRTKQEKEFYGTCKKDIKSMKCHFMKLSKQLEKSTSAPPAEQSAEPQPSNA